MLKGDTVMNIMVIGAYGKAGRLIMEQALKRGHRVTGVAHHKYKGFDFDNILIKNIMDLTQDDVSEMDAVVDAVGVWTSEKVSVLYWGLLHIVRLLAGTKVHYLKVGGANTLYINSERTRILQELPSYYPKDMQELCDAHKEALDILRRFSDVRWTYVTPAYKFAPLGRYTGHYHVGGETFTPAKGNNPVNGRNDYISYADYAKGVVDIIENDTYIRQRITLTSGSIPDENLIW